jgi:hypothetical protein
MNKFIAQQILKLLDSPLHVETLAAYAGNEIKRCHENLEGCSDMLQVARLQGEIAALKQLKKLRDTAAKVIENEARNPTPSSR